MTKTLVSMSRSTALGCVAIGLLVVGGALQVAAVSSGTAAMPMASATCLRMGIVLFALWLAYDDLRRIPRWLLVGLLVVIGMAVWQPRLLVAVIPILLAVAALRPRLSDRPKSRP